MPACSAAAPVATPPDLAPLVRYRWWARDAALAILAGLGLAFAFPPLEWSWLAWFALLPLLLVPVPAPLWRRLSLGLLLGAALFIPNLWWLNTIGFGAGTWLALYCLLYPALWYALTGALARVLARHSGLRTAAGAVGAVWLPDLPSRAQAALVLLLPALWVALEWVRGWLFTGFSWNQLGISQWQQPNLLPLATVTGVYGISFLLVAVNVALATGAISVLRNRWVPGRRPAGLAWPLPLAALLLLAPLAVRWSQAPLPPPTATLRVAAAQGCMELCRDYSDEQLLRSIDLYSGLSRQALRQPVKPELVVWPETAVPAALRFEPRYREALARLLAETRTPHLIGSIDWRPEEAPGDPQPPVYNSIFLVDGAGVLRQFYDKIHCVPFGEFTPFGKQLPWLVDLIGMGRDLSPGRSFTLFRLPHDIQAGALICYEDAFPALPSEFTRRGADLLLTLTNDAWYAESAGARQHLLHAVFRAVEQRRPLLRSGNNSDTCLILPDGRIQGLVRDPVSGHPFYRGVGTYDIPVRRQAPLTWYARHGDRFAHGCAGVALLLALALLAEALHRRQRLWTRVLTRVQPPPVG